MTEKPEKWDRFIAWAEGKPLDGSRDYHALESAQRFEIFEANMEKAARTALIKINDDKGQADR